MNINFDLNKLIQHKLSFEAWFVLYCLNENNEKILIDYVKSCRKIPTELFYDLKEKNLILINDKLVIDEKITYNSLKLTAIGKEIFKIQDFDILFKELREAYPEKVGNKLEERRLHTDLKRCKALYKKIIEDDINLHIIICRCAKLYHNEKKRSNSEIYMQNLATWLHQENYKQYIEEAEKLDFNLLQEGVQSEDI